MIEKIQESFAKTRLAGSIAASTLDEVSNIIKPGITTSFCMFTRL
jgi:methionine aminopeptidase